ncbi:MAG: extracellular solute-binding protein [Oscillospiraceae bacterium]|nr:extracellular solute-binding protein [Oscillospiraceae bacterium]
MKKAFSLLLVLSFVFSVFSVMAPVTGAAEKGPQTVAFQDVKESDWFYEFVMTAAENGLVNGVSADSFAPNNHITRGQFATILYRQLGSPSIKDLPNPFKDLEADWYKDAVIYMSGIGVINGLSKDTFGPAKNITREQMVTMLYRMANTTAKPEDAVSKFEDGSSVSHWALDAMNWAIGEGIISGTNKGLLLPRGNATRAQAAKVICLNFGLSRVQYDNVTLRFWQGGGDEENTRAAMRLLLDKFELTYPGITVDYKTIPWDDDPHTQFRDAIANDDNIDLIVLGSPEDFRLAAEGSLLPLDDLLSKSVKNDLYDLVKEQGTYRGSENMEMNGKLMSIPLYGSPNVTLYNREIFDFFGVAYPCEGMSHADLLETAKKVTGEMNGKQVYGYGTRPTTAAQYMQFVWNYGAQLIDPFTMTPGTDSPEWKKGIEDYLSFYNAGVVHPDAVNMPTSATIELFMNGESAMFVSPIDYARDILSTPVAAGETPWAQKLAVAPLAGETYTTTYFGADSLAVPVTTDHPKEAALLLNFLLSTKAQVLYNQVTGLLPAVKSALADPYYTEDPIAHGFAKAMEGAHLFDNYGVPGLGSLLKQYIQKLINGEITMEEYQAALTEAINHKIAEANGVVTLRFLQGGDNPVSTSIMRLLLDKFELLNPGIVVEYEAIPWEEDPHSQFKTAMDNGENIDLMVMGSPDNFLFAEEGRLYPLNRLLTQSVIDDLPDAVINQNAYPGSANADMYGELMSLPLYNSTYALMYNKGIFDYFGVEYPTESMTHAELLELAKKLTGEMNGDQVYGYGTRANTAAQYMQFVWNYGAQVIDPYTMTAGTDSVKWEMGIRDYAAFYEAGVVHEDSAIMTGAALMDLFTSEQIAMMVGPYDYVTTILEDSYWNDRLGIAPMAGEFYSIGYCGADYLAVPANTTHPQETALLVNYLLSTESQVTFCKGIDCFPTVKSAIADPYFAEDPIRAEFAKAVEGGHYFETYGVAGIGTLLKNYLQEFLAGNITIEEYQAQLTEAINAKIQEIYG